MGLREEIRQAVEGGEWQRAMVSLEQFWKENPGSASAGFLLHWFNRLKLNTPVKTLKIAILRSYTLEPAVPILKAAAAIHGLDVMVHLSDFNSYSQEILDPASALYGFAPDIAILAVQTRDIAPEFWTEFADCPPQTISSVNDRVLSSFRSMFRAFRDNTSAHLIVHGLDQLPTPVWGVLDNQVGFSQAAAIQELNKGIRKLAKEYPGIYVLDYDALISRHGRDRWYDERKFLTARLPIGANNLVALVNEWVRFIHPLAGRVSKALVVDLDNTLWGGVVGEDGIHGIKVDAEYPGASYRALQRVMLDLHKRGILLAICSKNNRDDGMEVLEKHPGMLLRPEHFAAVRINWNDKAENIREIAQELNIGLDSIAFLDDNDAERARVKMEAPEVHVIELPNDPTGYAAALRNDPVFERLSLSSDDLDRNRLYLDEKKRTEAAHNYDSVEDFYRSLSQEVEISPVTAHSLTRVAQLTQKTNQFNVTTRRYNEQQIAELALRPGWAVYSINVKDRFGDNGCVGVLITRTAPTQCEIDSFLLSCRVIGRTLETAAMAFLVSQARLNGATHLVGTFVPTRKNAPAKDLFEKHNFEPVAFDEHCSQWSLDLARQEVLCPEWIRLVVRQGYVAA